MKALIISAFFFAASSACAHDIYTGVHGKDNQLCCGGSDCAPTKYKITDGHYEFLTREGSWVEIPEDRITFLPIPGESPDDVNFAHLCYRIATVTDRTTRPESVFGNIFLYCAFIPPGAT
jgi:hypothetical protein